MKVLHIIALILFIIPKVNAQNETHENDFVPSGSPFMDIFTNYHSSFSDGKHSNLFEIKRAAFGYKYKFSKNFSGKIKFDVGNPEVGDLQMTTHLKNAFLKYTWKDFTVNFGLINTTQFAIQQKNWGNRYILKSFQHAYGFGSSADIGLNLDYKFNDFICADFSVLNGEGYKKIVVDTIVKVALGITTKPIKDITIRVYYDYMGLDSAQQTLAFFGGYSGDVITFGGEYNIQFNHDMINDQDYSGYSFYSSYSLNDKIRFFGRYDKLTSEIIFPGAILWNFTKDGQLFIAGIEFSPVKGVRIAPNFQGWDPEDTDQSFISSIFLNCEIKF